MDRLITVKSKGRIFVKPDYIRISMLIESKHKAYDKAMEKAADRIDSLVSVLAAVGFAEYDIKTSDFSVRTTSEYRRMLGHSKEVETGFKVSQHVKIGFGLDLEKLADTLAAIAQWSKSDPDLTVEFTVRDPAAVRDAVLQAAAENARRQAETLCAASGVKLGNLVRVDYSWTEAEYRSSTGYRTYCDSRTITKDVSLMSLSRDTVVRMQPDDIDAHDSATFVWEIG